MVIGSRVLTLQGEHDDIKVAIRISAPQLENTGAWGCQYEIDWPEGKHAVTIFGFDSAQALLLAMQTIGVEIYSSSYHKAGKLFLDKPGNGYGFPVVPTLRDLLEGDDEKYL